MTKPGGGSSRFGHDVLSVFDVWQDTRDFLADAVEALGASAETERLLRQSLTAGAEDWHYLIECAESIRRDRGNDVHSLDPQDVLAYVWDIFKGMGAALPTANPWDETDRLIAQAKALEQDPEILKPSFVQPIQQKNLDDLTSSQPLVKPKTRVTTSHYWSDEAQGQNSIESRNWSNLHQAHSSFTHHPAHSPLQPCESGACPALVQPASIIGIEANSQAGESHRQYKHSSIDVEHMLPIEGGKFGVNRFSKFSPYFTSPPSSSSATEVKKCSTRKRPPPGTIATVPFAPLASPKFGLVQEEFAHDPFWLLVAVAFLIKTNGKLAIPVFYKVKERFPTLQDIANPVNAEEIINMIRHLGLSANRVAFMQKYARGFLDDPPRPGLTHKVKNYDCRDIVPLSAMTGTMNNGPLKLESNALLLEDSDELEAWEIGHLTKGKYTIDSWRIFCRDELLGRAEDWNGKGREPEFQPEWMRVMPQDKELRAYLRWMWMREGWEWDPVTGERAVLREEMQRAVNEGRVEYDDTGGLRVLDELQSG